MPDDPLERAALRHDSAAEMHSRAAYLHEESAELHDRHAEEMTTAGRPADARRATRVAGDERAAIGRELDLADQERQAAREDRAELARQRRQSSTK
jgi:hypothetical protein